MNMFLIISDHLPIIAPVWLRNDYEIVRRATFKKSRYCLCGMVGGYRLFQAWYLVQSAWNSHSCYNHVRDQSANDLFPESTFLMMPL